MQLEDARRLQSGGQSLFRTDWTRKYIHGVIASRSLGSYFLLGALFSLVRAPCVGGVDIAIIGIISSQGYASSGLLYLLIYNLGILLPVLLLGGIIALGMSPDQVDQFKEQTSSCHPFDYGNYAVYTGSDHLLATCLKMAEVVARQIPAEALITGCFRAIVKVIFGFELLPDTTNSGFSRHLFELCRCPCCLQP